MFTPRTNPVPETAAIRPVTPQTLQSTAVANSPPASTPAASPPAAVVISQPVAAGPAPIDSDRVAAIKAAIQTNSYPLLPAKIGDAMIAAGMLLEIAR